MNRNNKGQFARKSTEDVIDAEVSDEKFTAYSELFAEMFEVKHPVMGFLTNIAVTVLGLHGAFQVAVWLGVGSLIMSGSAFLALLIAITTFILLAIQALRAGSIAGKYIATGEFESDYQSAKGWISNKFQASKTWVAHTLNRKEAANV